MDTRLDRTSIEFDGEIPRSWRHSRKIRSFIAARLAGYLDQSGGRGAAHTVVISLQRLGAGHLVDCYVEIRAGSRRWLASQSAPGLEQALIRCLDHLRPDVDKGLPTA